MCTVRIVRPSMSYSWCHGYEISCVLKEVSNIISAHAHGEEFSTVGRNQQPKGIVTGVVGDATSPKSLSAENFR